MIHYAPDTHNDPSLGRKLHVYTSPINTNLQATDTRDLDQAAARIQTTNLRTRVLVPPPPARVALSGK